MNIARDFWLNDLRLTFEAAKDYVNARKWWRIRDGYWASSDSVMQMEIVPTESGAAGLVWIISL